MLTTYNKCKRPILGTILDYIFPIDFNAFDTLRGKMILQEKQKTEDEFMDFTEEMNTIRGLDQGLTYIVSYEFQRARIKLYVRYDRRDSNPKRYREYLILVVDSKEDCLVHQYNVIDKGDGGYWINGYLEGDMLPILLDDNNKLLSFNESLKKAILSIVHNGETNIKVERVESAEGEQEINDAVKKDNGQHQHHSQQKGRFFWYTKSSKNITTKQADKIRKCLGPNALDYLKRNHLTAAFTDDPMRQRTLRLGEVF